MILKIINLPKLKFLYFFNFIGFGIATLSDSDGDGYKFLVNISKFELGFYLAWRTKEHVDYEKQNESGFSASA
jgi:hypothetical protein